MDQFEEVGFIKAESLKKMESDGNEIAIKSMKGA